MTNHTPGPWHIGMKPGPIVYGPQGEEIADLRDSLLSKGEALANQALIIAAPATAAERDALQAQLVRLRAALEAAQEHVSHAAYCPARHSGECICIRAEIAEALARSSSDYLSLPRGARKQNG